MRDDDVAHGVALFVRTSDGNASGVNRHAVVNQVTGQPLLLCGAALLIERAW
jgi:hypothetical protein